MLSLPFAMALTRRSFLTETSIPKTVSTSLLLSFWIPCLNFFSTLSSSLGQCCWANPSHHGNPSNLIQNGIHSHNSDKNSLQRSLNHINSMDKVNNILIRKAAESPSTSMTDTPSSKPIRILFNGGDNMLGRAVQLTFPHQTPGDDTLTDSCTAAHYLKLSMHENTDWSDATFTSEKENIQILHQIRKWNENDASYLWNDYATLPIVPSPDVRILNLETAVTTSIDNDDVPQWKLRYHFHEKNAEIALKGYQKVTNSVESSTADANAGGDKREVKNKAGGGSPVVVTFANNHALDCGKRAFVEETLPRFQSITETSEGNIQFAGVGHDWNEAAMPVSFVLPTGKRVKIFAVGCHDSGVPSSWSAGRATPGMCYVDRLESVQDVNNAFQVVSDAIQRNSKPNEKDLIILSIHWGPNWAYRHTTDAIEQSYRRQLAHRLMDEAGMDLIYGHSSHHVRGMEVYNHKLICYGTGDLINDYEGFTNRGEEKYPSLGGIFLVDLDRDTNCLDDLIVVPTYMDKLRLCRWKEGCQQWDPIVKEMVERPDGLDLFCDFVNRMSELDAGEKEKDGKALGLVLENESLEIPGGPVLRWDKRL